MLAIKALTHMPVCTFAYYASWGYGKGLWIISMILASLMVPAAFAATLIWGPAIGGAVLGGFAAATCTTVQEFLGYCWKRNSEWRRLEARRAEARRSEYILAVRRHEQEIEARWERENAAMAA
jgi:fatty acid desaturase